MFSIKKITGLQRPDILQHLFRLDDDGKLLRFGYVISTDNLQIYVNKINFNRDIVLGLFCNDLLVGFCHGVGYHENGIAVAEIGISIENDYRSNGCGYQMLKDAFELAKLKSIKKIYIHTLKKNKPMQKILEKLNGQMSIQDDEVIMSFDISEVSSEDIMKNYFVDGIEVIEKTVNPEGKTILFIHGAGGDAWQWQRNFIPYFAKRGINSIAISLPNHGNSKEDRAYSLDNYIKLIDEWKNRAGKDCILVGHSMGGFLLQKYAADYKISNKIILLASLPPFNPANLEKGFLTLIEEQLKCSLARSHLNKLLINAPAIDTENIESDLIFLAGINDPVIPLAWKKKISHHYRAPLFTVEGGHNLMVDKSWEQSALVISENI